ncbi:MAG: peptidase domain-containing ABC transporter [Mariprofundus sp.]|nr:peptidase domain-containing ABC transporter [Mariprofundus sp.]
MSQPTYIDEKGRKHPLPIAPQGLLWALQSACQLHRVPFSGEIALRQHPPPYSTASLQQILQSMEMKSRWKKVKNITTHKLRSPALALLSPLKDSEDDVSRIVLLVKIEDGTVLFFEQGDQQPKSLAAEVFSQEFTGHLLRFSPPKGKGVEKERKPFGFSWFVPELLKHKKIWRDILLASLLIQLMALATPLFTQVIIDKVIVHQTQSTLMVIGIGMVMFMVFNAVMSWVRQYLVNHTGNRIDAVLGAHVFSHLFRLPVRYFEHRSTGTLVARLQGIESIREFLSGAAVTLILDIPFLFIFLAIMYYYSWMLTLIAVGILLAIAVLSLAITPSLRKRLDQQFLLGARNQAYATEYISGMETVKSLQMEPQVTSRYGDYLASYLEAGFNARQLSNSYNVAANTLEQLMTLLILCFGAWLVMTTDGFTIGMLVAFQMFAGRLSQPVLRMVGLWQQFQQADIAVKRLGDVMDAPQEPYSIKPSHEGGGKGKIQFGGVSFRYSDQLPYLYRNFNLCIEPGQCVAIMGPSGSGKSTLTKLLQGFYMPNDGHIQIDGRDIRNFSANELRQYFGVVPQETILFSGTIYENLVLANPHANFAQVVRACKQAEIHNVIEALPEGYQTEIGERGSGLSGGQKQRLAIARALLKQPKILLFDEATSSLDAGTAEVFAATVNQLKGKITMLFITHQIPNTLKVDVTIQIGDVFAGKEQVNSEIVVVQ